MNTEIIRIIIEVVLGGTSLISLIAYWKANRRIKDNEANKSDVEVTAARFELYEQRLEHCNQAVENHNNTILSQGETISTLNKALDDKTARIRQLTDDLYTSEKESNRLNDRLVEATEKIGKLELSLMKYKDWHCQVADCPHRLPPNPKLKGRTFNDDTTA